MAKGKKRKSKKSAMMDPSAYGSFDIKKAKKDKKLKKEKKPKKLKPTTPTFQEIEPLCSSGDYHLFRDDTGNLWQFDLSSGVAAPIKFISGE